MASILIIDDDEQICGLLARRMAREGHSSQSAHTLEQGINLARDTGPDIVLLDVRLPDGNGLEALPDIMGSPSNPEVIIITGLGDPDGAEMAIKSGAWGYLEKGSPMSTMLLTLSRALEYRSEKLSTRQPMALKRSEIVGSSPLMMGCYDLLAQAASGELNVLINGDTGTGKELFARCIHENSKRSSGPFVVVDCAALPETLVESILFGHEKGAYTGAHRYQEGLVKHADKGTLFLDEVGELPLTVQKSFLRVLQERKFRMVGGGQEISSDFRLLAATNRDLDKMAEDGRFRTDLLFRLRSMQINIPRLTEREGDLDSIVTYHLRRICQRYGMRSKGVSQGFLEALAAYDWPGNVRELVGALEQAVTAAASSPTLYQKHLPEAMRVAVAKAALSVAEGANPGSSPAPPLSPAEPLPPLREMLQNEKGRLEKWYLKELMSRTGGDIKKACDISGMCRSVLYNNLKKHGLSRRG